MNGRGAEQPWRAGEQDKAESRTVIRPFHILMFIDRENSGLLPPSLTRIQVQLKQIPYRRQRWINERHYSFLFWRCGTNSIHLGLQLSLLDEVSCELFIYCKWWSTLFAVLIRTPLIQCRFGPYLLLCRYFPCQRMSLINRVAHFTSHKTTSKVGIEPLTYTFVCNIVKITMLALWTRIRID